MLCLASLTGSSLVGLDEGQLLDLTDENDPDDEAIYPEIVRLGPAAPPLAAYAEDLVAALVTALVVDLGSNEGTVVDATGGASDLAVTAVPAVGEQVSCDLGVPGEGSAARRWRRDDLIRGLGRLRAAVRRRTGPCRRWPGGRSDPGPERRRSPPRPLGALVAARGLTTVPGTLMATDTPSSAGGVRVLRVDVVVCGARDLSAVPDHQNVRIDPLALETAYPRARRTEPDDVVHVTTHRRLAIVDREGFSVVRSSARVLRCVPGSGVLPDILAVTINELPPGARAWRAWKVAVVPDESQLSVALLELDTERQRSRQRLRPPSHRNTHPRRHPMKTTQAIVAVPVCLVLLAGCGGDDVPPAVRPTSAATVTETVTSPAATGTEATVTVTEPAPAAAAATVTVTETVTAEAAPEPAPAPEPEEDAEPDAEESVGQLAFGETWTWEDGTSVTVSGPEEFTPGEYASGGEGYDHHVQFTISVENGSGEPLDLALFTVTMQSGTSEGDEVFDTDNGMEGSPFTTLLDGRAVEFVVGFGVEDPDDLVMQLAPTWDHDSAFFTN